MPFARFGEGVAQECFGHGTATGVAGADENYGVV